MFFISKKQKRICKVLLFKNKIAGSIFAHPKNLLASGRSQPTEEEAHFPPGSSAWLCPHSAPRETHGICTDAFGSRARTGKFKWLQEEVTGQPVLLFSCMFQSKNKCSPAIEQHFNTQEGLISQAMGLANPGMSPISPH